MTAVKIGPPLVVCSHCREAIADAARNAVRWHEHAFHVECAKALLIVAGISTFSPERPVRETETAARGKVR